MGNVNQTIIIRTDLFDREDVGLISAQVGHIHFNLMRQIILRRSSASDHIYELEMKLRIIGEDYSFDPEDMMNWLAEPYLLVKQVPNKEALVYFTQEAERARLPVSKWIDTVYIRFSKTQQKAFTETLVGISIGPSDADKIRTVVGDLPLL